MGFSISSCSGLSLPIRPKSLVSKSYIPQEHFKNPAYGRLQISWHVWIVQMTAKTQLIKQKKSFVTCYLSHVMCQMSQVKCHMSHDTWHQQPQSQTRPLLTPPLCKLCTVHSGGQTTTTYPRTLRLIDWIGLGANSVKTPPLWKVYEPLICPPPNTLQYTIFNRPGVAGAVL